MQQSGLDGFLLAHQETDLVYGGFNAGAVVVSPTLLGVHLVDSPEVVSDAFATAIEWDGLALVPYRIAPHFDSDHPESERINHLINYFQDDEIPFKTIRDGDVYITRVSPLETKPINS